MSRHERNRTPGAFFMTKSCEHTKGSTCQRATDFPFQWVVNTFTWNGPTGTYNVGGAHRPCLGIPRVV